jgi:hypothetical protein
MPSIGNIVVKRIIEHKLLPPVYESVTKGPTFTLEQSQPVPHLVPPSLIGAGGQSPKPHKEVFKFITQSVTVGAGTVNKVKVSGIVGISYTQTSFTFVSYTIAGVAISKSLSQTITITEPLAVQRRKARRLSPEIDLAELSHTLKVARTKTRAITQSTIISENLTAAVSTKTEKILTETNAITESLTRPKQSKRSQLETVSESGDVSISLPGISRSLTQSISISDAVSFVVTHPGGINIAKTLSEIVNISDSIIRRLQNYRALTQIIVLADSVVKLIVTSRRSFSRSFTLVSFTATARAEKSLFESIAESHTLRMALTKKRSVPAQTVNIAEQLSAVVTRGRAADIVPVTDEVQRSVGTSKVLGDSIIISDLLTSSQADIVPITDTVIRVVGRNRSLSQSVTIIG